MRSAEGVNHCGVSLEVAQGREGLASSHLWQGERRGRERSVLKPELLGCSLEEKHESICGENWGY